jgi:hypothetical protein
MTTTITMTTITMVTGTITITTTTTMVQVLNLAHFAMEVDAKSASLVMDTAK